MPNPKIETVQYLLRSWSHWSKNWFPHHLAYPSAVPYLDEMRASPSESPESQEGPDPWQLHATDQAINSLPKPFIKTLRWNYLNEPSPPGAVELLPMAENALIPQLERRNILL